LLSQALRQCSGCASDTSESSVPDGDPGTVFFVRRALEILVERIDVASVFLGFLTKLIQSAEALDDRFGLFLGE
jgi:hypothetical protein